MLLTHFDAWLQDNLRTTLEAFLALRELDCEAISDALVAFGREMYLAGKSYSRFAETIHALTARRLMLRRNLASAWDLAFNWVVDEPHEHNAALPLSLMLAAVTLSLLWGWVREAAAIALAWVGVLRIGEVFAAKREDLVLPADAAPGFDSALLKVRQPKTRGRAARHQSSRIDPQDIVLLLVIAYGDLVPGEALWPWAPGTLRRRFSHLLAALGLPQRADGSFAYSPNSLRPGGATHTGFK